MPVTVEADTDARKALNSNLLRAFLKGFAIPAIVLIFFTSAPSWLNYRLHSEVVREINASSLLSSSEKEQRIDVFAKIDFAAVCRGEVPELQQLRANFERSGICAHFQRLVWGFRLSVVLMSVLLLATGTTLFLNRRARESRAALIWSYRIGWRLGIVAALTKVFLLIPLLGYGLFELTSLAMDRYFPQAIIMIVLGGVIALWRSVVILLKKVPLEFAESMSCEVTPEAAPELWRAVREAAARLNTAPPDRILVGMQLNFYVSELAVKHDFGRVDGRTLFLSHPLLKQLSPDEVLAIIGHELGHFIGEDTRITREFYPLRFKANATMYALAQSGWIGWTSVHVLGFFNWCFGATEHAMSRERELMADRTAAALTSPETIGRALVKFHVINEAVQLGIAGARDQRLDNLFDAPLGTFIREHLLPKTVFWTQLFEKKTPHPLDSHPSLRVRLAALGQQITADDAMTLSIEATESAYDRWLSGRDALFAGLVKQATDAVAKIRTRVDAAKADYQTDEGRELLEANFPERRWRIRAFSFWMMMSVWGLIVAGLGVGVVFGDGAVLKAVFGVAVLLAVAASAAMWRRHRHGEYVLRADSLSYTGWHRPIIFSSVESVSAVNTNGTITVTFRLKAREPGIWKYSMKKIRRKSVAVNLGWINGKQQEVFQTFHQYFTRQIKE